MVVVGGKASEGDKLPGDRVREPMRGPRVFAYILEIFRSRKRL